MSQDPRAVETARLVATPASRKDECARCIVLVEDDDALREVAARMLTRLGYEVVAARHGGDALMFCDAHRETVALVIADVVMPEMGGVRLAEHLAGRTPAIPIILMSGYTVEAPSREGAAAVAAVFLEKPFTTEALAAVVREVLPPASAPITAP